jgi:hypothetical protein
MWGTTPLSLDFCCRSEEAVDWNQLAEMALKVGVPTAMGVAILYYLLKHHIPTLSKDFKESLEKQQGTFKEALTEQKDNFNQTLNLVVTNSKEQLGAVVEAHKQSTALLAATIETNQRECVSAIKDTNAMAMKHREEEGARTRAALDGLASEVRELSKMTGQGRSSSSV